MISTFESVHNAIKYLDNKGRQLFPDKEDTSSSLEQVGYEEGMHIHRTTEADKIVKAVKRLRQYQNKID